MDLSLALQVHILPALANTQARVVSPRFAGLECEEVGAFFVLFFWRFGPKSVNGAP